ncbi:hypothetical protein [Roseovarius dicentrarchi]|uniref:hypothetical protein n=1 Tax=Roseovarius dicentrarchi TaxID=2250573 RepID=UPI0013966E65|nr:hypothetical protein [Roseovarius dicentrarchi]
MINIQTPRCGSVTVHLTLRARCPRRLHRHLWMAALWAAQCDVSLKHGAICHAATALPDRVIAVWTLPQQHLRPDFGQFEGDFAASIHASDNIGDIERIALKLRPIRHKSHILRYVDDCHFAPVRYGWAKTPDDWPLSTFDKARSSEMILS